MKKLVFLILAFMAMPAMAAEVVGFQFCMIGQCNSKNAIKGLAQQAAADALLCPGANCQAEVGEDYEYHVTVVNGGFRHYIWTGRVQQITSTAVAWSPGSMPSGRDSVFQWARPARSRTV